MSADVVGLVSEALCSRHQAGSPTRQPCAACAQEATALVDGEKRAVLEVAAQRIERRRLARRRRWFRSRRWSGRDESCWSQGMWDAGRIVRAMAR